MLENLPGLGNNTTVSPDLEAQRTDLSYRDLEFVEKRSKLFRELGTPSILVSFPVSVIKFSDKSNLSEKGFALAPSSKHSLLWWRSQGHGNSKQTEHISFAVGRRDECMPIHARPENGATHNGQVTLPQLTQDHPLQTSPRGQPSLDRSRLRLPSLQGDSRV